MSRIGPIWRQRPSPITTYQEWMWCWLLLDKQGRVFAIEWCEP